MKPIKIQPKNAASIDAVLRATNGKAESHTFTTWKEIEQVAHDAEQQLVDLHIPIKARHGAAYTAVSGAKMPNAYKYNRQATHVRLERNSGGWRLVNIDRVTIWREPLAAALHLTPDQDQIAIARLRDRYVINGA